MRVVDVVAGAVGQHGIDQVRFDLGRQRVELVEAPRVGAGLLVFEVPADALAQEAVDVSVDDHRRRRHGIGVARAAMDDAELSLDANDLVNRHRARP